MLMEQTSACDSMIDEKNKLIHDFQQVNKFQYLHVSSGFFFNNTTWKNKCSVVPWIILFAELSWMIRPILECIFN